MTVDPLLIRAMALYGPALIVGGLAFSRRPGARWAAGAFLATAWNIPALLLLNVVAERLGWWEFQPLSFRFLGMPVDMLIGWALLWGAIPVLAVPSIPWLAAVLVIWLDLILMPLAAPVVVLGSNWLYGEAAGIGAALIPALALGRWTAEDRRLEARVLLQVVLFGALAAVLLPIGILHWRGVDLLQVIDFPTWRLAFAAQVLALPAVVALAAVQEFALRGGGTPFPWDPPKRLVTTGPYAYVANPMQAGMAFSLVLMAAFLGNVWLAAAVVVLVAFSGTLAAQHEDEELRDRFGQSWTLYRSHVRPWWPRWRPHIDRPAQIYLASTCLVCSALARWLIAQSTVGLVLLPAEQYAGIPRTRLTYVAETGGIEEGIGALARALEHIHLGWAVVGWTIRLPLLRHIIQVLADAVGTGPRTLPRSPQTTGSATNDWERAESLTSISRS